ncbi:ATP-binding protein [Azoarcus sp. KH32C]|uniref:ATP-binding protein n=1 Tax=Azoarcus sp. KH32C TaxID=748247 RepID=UPI003510A9AE
MPGDRVLFTSAAQLIATLSKALAEGPLGDELRLDAPPQLLIIDEIRYLPIDCIGATPSRQCPGDARNNFECRRQALKEISLRRASAAQKPSPSRPGYFVSGLLRLQGALATAQKLSPYFAAPHSYQLWSRYRRSC